MQSWIYIYIYILEKNKKFLEKINSKNGMAQKDRNKSGCHVVKYVLCVVSTHKAIAPYPYIWQQHVANQ